MELPDLGLSSQFQLTVGIILLSGLLISALSARTFLPRVTLLLIFGGIIGPVLTRYAIRRTASNRD